LKEFMKMQSTEEYFGEDKHLAETDRRYPRTLNEAFPHQPTLTPEPAIGFVDVALLGIICFGLGYLVRAFYELGR
jgi:hypothetical protein